MDCQFCGHILDEQNSSFYCYNHKNLTHIAFDIWNSKNYIWRVRIQSNKYILNINKNSSFLYEIYQDVPVIETIINLSNYHNLVSENFDQKIRNMIVFI